MSKIPDARTVRRVIAHLDDMGLSIYGQMTCMATGQMYPSLKDYSVDDVIRLRHLIRHDMLQEVQSDE